MAFENRREILFVYSVKDANPNGDPLNSNHPRYDDDSGRILVSDVRVKRTIRDQWIREGKDVFVDGETKTLEKRVNELKAKFRVDSGKEALARCVDTRLFGVTFALGKDDKDDKEGKSKSKGEAFAWTGPVQFKWGRSLHRAEVMMIQGTAAFATKKAKKAKDEQDEQDEKKQRSFRNEYIVPFALIADYAIANQYASVTTGATDEDLDFLFDSIWRGTANLITRSKVGHQPRLLMEINYREKFDGIIGALDEKISLRGKNGEELSSDQEQCLRSCDELSIDISKLLKSIDRVDPEIKAVRLVHDSDLNIVQLNLLEQKLGERLKKEER
ncbi:MAG: type I-B CRISPR-associated protein Cas7/Csh2 [Synergistaceae bacterium]|jgi:CRISPR-associated protein Csh2|nr:type I-B CRISPR-associated protein Cas7/Csh2 [Synergistaceae bacterium]